MEGPCQVGLGDRNDRREAVIAAVASSFVGSAEAVRLIVGRILALDRPGECGEAFLVHGGPGTGKSTLVRALAEELPLTSALIHGREPGALEVALEALELACLPARCAPRDAAGSAGVRLLLLDNVDAFAPRTAISTEQGAHLVARLCALLDIALARDDVPVFVVGFCEQPAAIAPSVCRSGRLHRQVALRLPSPAERSERALRSATPLLKAGFCTADDLRAAALSGHGLTIAEIDAAFARTAHAAARASATPGVGNSGGGSSFRLGAEALAGYVRMQRRGRLMQAHAADGAGHFDGCDGMHGMGSGVDGMGSRLGKALALSPELESELGGGSANVELGALPSAAGGAAHRARAALDGFPGLESAAASLRRRVVLPVISPPTLAAWGIRPSRGVLLHGPPGCGKTALAHAAAAESGANVLSVQAASLLGPVVGHSEANVRSLFARARAAAPCVLILDQLEALAPPRGSDSSSEQTLDRTLSTLLSEMDGVGTAHLLPAAEAEAAAALAARPSQDADSAGGDDDGTARGAAEAAAAAERAHALDLELVIVIAICQSRAALDAAILRPGRLDEHIFIGLPSERARAAILRHGSSGMPLAPDVDFAQIAASTAGFSGAELLNICREAGLCCVREEIGGGRAGAVTAAHFAAAFARSHSVALHDGLEPDDGGIGQ